MFHSLLSSSLNIGLITPQEVVDKTIKYYEKNKKEVKIISETAEVEKEYKNEVSSLTKDA